MPDFIVVIDEDFRELPAAEAALTDRPGMEEVSASSWTFGWGTVTAQQARCPGYKPHANETAVHLSVGRPRRVGSNPLPGAGKGFSGQICEAVNQGERQIERWYRELTGMFALVSADVAGVTIFTDALGSYPVYHAESKTGQRTVLGTHPEIVADLAGRQSDWDPVSLGEIILRESITFPYTTRHGMWELGPGRQHRFEIGRTTQPTHTERVLWEPREPDRWPSLKESRAQLEAALRGVGDDITRGCRRTFVTLSGGTDSRTVLAAIPPDRRGGAVTFCDHENTETRVAAAVAQTASVEHYLVYRDPEFYAELADIEPRLLGIERGMAHSHGVALAREPSLIEPDLLLDGFLSDTLLKSHVFAVTPELIGKGLRGYLFNSKSPLLEKSSDKGSQILTTNCYDAILQRMRNREDELGAIRPSSASEWARFYPASRQHHFSYAAANMRLFPSDQFFLHRDIVELAAETHWIFKGLRLLTPPVFARLCGPTAEHRTASNPRPMSASCLMQTWDKIVARGRRASRRRRRQHGSEPTTQPSHWFTDGSWIDFAQFQRASPRWENFRQLCPSARAEALESVLAEPVTEAVRKYREDLGPFRNYSLIKMLRHISRVRERADANARRS